VHIRGPREGTKLLRGVKSYLDEVKTRPIIKKEDYPPLTINPSRERGEETSPARFFSPHKVAEQLCGDPEIINQMICPDRFAEGSL
jgi:hypothetical protein